MHKTAWAATILSFSQNLFGTIHKKETNLSLDGKLSLWEGPHFSERLAGLEALFMGSKSFPDGASLLGAEVQRFVFLALESNLLKINASHPKVE